MNQLLDQFMDYLSVERGLSSNTLEAYRRDLTKFFGFLDRESSASTESVDPSDIIA